MKQFNFLSFFKRKNKKEEQQFDVMAFFKQKMYLECLQQGMTHEEAREFVYNHFREE